jgi:hypothetical protein
LGDHFLGMKCIRLHANEPSTSIHKVFFTSAATEGS